MRSKTLWIATMLVLAPLGLQAQQGAASAEARIEAAMQAAVEAGVPVSLLEQKIAEGKAKGVPMARIAAAVEARQQTLVQARYALEQARLESTTTGELSVAADAVEAGVSQTALIAISETTPQERRAVAIAVLTDLVNLGQASEQALIQVQAAVQRGPEALVNLRAETATRLQTQGVTGAGVQVDAGAGARVELGTRRPQN
jgi:hypothetical protein